MEKGQVRNKQIYITFIVLICSVVGRASFAAEPTVFISPKKIVPGGLMVVTVKNVPGPVEGSFRGKTLHFNQAKGSYKAVTGIDLNVEPGAYRLALTAGGKELSR